MVAFGVFGEDVTQQQFKEYKKTFKRLKDAYLPVIMSAARKDPKTLTEALHVGGAYRISGAYSVHKEP